MSVSWKISAVRLFLKIETLWKLGFINVLRVFWYRSKCRLHYYHCMHPVVSWSIECGTLMPKKVLLEISKATAIKLSENYDRNKRDQFCWYFHHWHTVPKKNIWQYDPFLQKSLPYKNKHWSVIKHFIAPGSDIKNLWELSRFYWMPQLALICALHNKDPSMIQYLVNDWCDKNKPNQGFQWVCAQETSIRLINFVLAFEFLLTKTQAFNIEFVALHLKRISQTLSYAIAQQNNHTTSEACGLIIGGCYLLSVHYNSRVANAYIQKGIYLLEQAIKKLVFNDGGFSQYSVTYHRLFLDSLGLSILYLLKNGFQISKVIQDQYQKASQWLLRLSIDKTCDMPNLGSNDGALLFNLTGHNYRDFSYSIALSQYICCLLENSVQFDSIAKTLTCTDITTQHQQASCDFYDFGLIKCYQHTTGATGFLRYPNFIKSFRPCQSDLLHFDLWHQGKNILIDSGSYSYNPVNASGHLKSVKNHNTVQFDGNEQMPILSRFLYGKWPVYTRKKIDFKQSKVCVEYRDYKDNCHSRTIQYNNTSWVVTDRLSHATATVIWHLGDLAWAVVGNKIVAKGVEIFVEINEKLLSPSLSVAHHSKYYQSLLQHNVCLFDLQKQQLKNTEGVTCITTVKLI